MQMMMVEQKWPVFGRHELAVEWLRVWAIWGAHATIDAYARALAEYLLSRENAGVDPIAASGRRLLRLFELTSRPNHLGVNVVSLDSGVGLANATLQQPLVAARLFYDYLIEEGRRIATRSAVAGTPRAAASAVAVIAGRRRRW